MLKSGDVWNDFARLKPSWRTSILRFLTQMSAKGWNLLSVEAPQRSPRIKVFGTRSDDPLVQLILFRRQATAAPPQPSSLMGDGKNPNVTPKPVPTRTGISRPGVDIQSPRVRFQHTDSFDDSDEAYGRASRSKRGRREHVHTEEDTAAHDRRNRPMGRPEPNRHTNTATISRRNYHEHGRETPPRSESSESDNLSKMLSVPQRDRETRREGYGYLSRLQQLQQQHRPQPQHDEITANLGAERNQPERNDTFNSIAEDLSRREPNLVSLDPAGLNQDRAVVLRPGGSRRFKDYMQDRVLNDSIRVRGHDIPGSVAGKSSRPRRLPSSVKPIREIHSEHGWSLARQLLRSKTHRESEDEEDSSIQSPRKQSSSEEKLSDEEMVLRTLRKFTTFPANVTPINAVANLNSPASAPFSSAPEGIKVQAPKAQTEDAQRERVGQDSRISLAPAAVGVPGQEPLSTKEYVESGQSKGLREDEVMTDQKFIFRGLDPGVIQDEPAEITEEDASTGAFASDASKKQSQSANAFFATDVASHQQESRSNFDFSRDPGDNNNSYFHYRNVASPVDEAGEETPEAEKLPQVREGGELNHPDTESISVAKTTKSRSATVEDFGLEIEEAE